jgi:hypothetical protein
MPNARKNGHAMTITSEACGQVDVDEATESYTCGKLFAFEEPAAGMALPEASGGSRSSTLLMPNDIRIHARSFAGQQGLAAQPSCLTASK